MIQNTITQKNARVSGKLIFLGSVFLIYVIIYIFFDQELVITSIQKTGQTFLKIVPILLIVFIIMIFMNYFITPSGIKKYLGKDSGIMGYFYATIFGIIISGPPYVLFPMLKDLKEKGVSNNLLAVFLYNRNIKIPFLIVMIYYFGINYTIIISILILIFSLLNGIIIGYFLDKKIDN